MKCREIIMPLKANVSVMFRSVTYVYDRQACRLDGGTSGDGRLALLELS